MTNRISRSPLFSRPEGFPFSLGTKILLPMLLVYIVTSLVLYAFYTDRIREQEMNGLKNQLEVFAASKAAELNAPLWNFQDTLVASLMHSYRDNRNLYTITLYNAKGDEIVRESVDNTDPGCTILTTKKMLTREVGGELLAIGKLVVQFHDGHLRAALEGRRFPDLQPAALLMVTVGIAAWLILHFMVGRPLHRLKMSLRHNATHNPRKPLVWDSQDELGEVVKEYNALLREVEHQTGKLMKNNAALQHQITQRKVAERQLSKAHEELEQIVAIRTMELRRANEELVRLDLQRSAFLSSASHELRTPLAAILGFSKLIRKNFRRYFAAHAETLGLDDKSEAMMGNLDIIAKEGDRLTRLINDLLDINKIEAGQMEWRDTLINIPDEIRRAAKTMAPQFENNTAVALEVDVPKAFPPLSFDPDRMQQLLINLLSNAYKHTDCGAIAIAASVAKGIIRITVSDTGRGIRPEDLGLIFQKFYQSESNDKGKPLGTGLGLPICQHIVEHYGGRMSVVSTMDAGSTFTVELPVDKPDQAAPQALA